MLTIINDTPLRRDPGTRYNDTTQDMAFACWIRAKGNTRQAHAFLVVECRQDETGLLPLEADAPDLRTLQRWVHDHNWEALLVESIARRAGGLKELYQARLIALGGPALDTLDMLMDPDRPAQKGDFVKADLAKTVVTLLGLGTAGTKSDDVFAESTQEDAPVVDISAMTPTELARLQRQRLIAEAVPTPKK